MNRGDRLEFKAVGTYLGLDIDTAFVRVQFDDSPIASRLNLKFFERCATRLEPLYEPQVGDIVKDELSRLWEATSQAIGLPRYFTGKNGDDVCYLSPSLVRLVFRPEGQS